jgi:hypothetical protein
MIILLAEQWLHGMLAGDAQLVALLPKYPGASPAIYGYVAPENVPYPVVIYSYQSGDDVYGSGKMRIMSQLVYQVKAVGAGATFSVLAPVADRIDELLHGAFGSVAGLSVLSCMRRAPVAYAEIDNGIQYRHLGGLYRLQVRPEEE